MPSRREFDVPAAAIAAAIGVAILLVSTPFTVQAYQKLSATGKDFTVAWSERTEAKDATQAQAAAARTSQSATVGLKDALVGTVQVTVTSCVDARPVAAAQPAATVHAKLTRGGKTLFEKDIPCQPGTVYSNTTAHPDIGTVKAAGADAAAKSLDAALRPFRFTGDVRLDITSTRPAGQAPPTPLPAGQATLAYQVELKVGQWAASLSEAPEVGK